MPQPLPESLGDRFSVGDARAAGVTRGRLRSADLDSPFHGVRTRVGLEHALIESDRHGRPRGTLEREHLAAALAYSTRMGEDAFFSHVTAAVLWDIPLPPQVLRNAPVDVAVYPPGRYPRRAGIHGHEARTRTARQRVHPVFGVRVATPATTWAMLGGVLREPRDIVAAADALVREWRTTPLATTEELRAAASAGRRVGVGMLRDALPRVRVRAGSRPESHLRLAVVDGMLPEPELNYDVFDGMEKIACVDLAYPELMIAIEYEGEHHLTDPQQWARDILRYERLAAAGWRVIRVTKSELFGDNRRLLARIRAAVRARS